MAHGTLSVDLTPEECIRLQSSASGSVHRMRMHCRDTDKRFGALNNMYREAIDCQRSASAKLLAALRAAGWPMEGQDIGDDPIDERIRAPGSTTTRPAS